jgi:CRP/FNR family transcriptional regulator
MRRSNLRPHSDNGAHQAPIAKRRARREASDRCQEQQQRFATRDESMINAVRTPHITESLHSAWYVHRGGVTADAAPGRLSDVLDLLGCEPDAWSTGCEVGMWRVPKGVALFHEQTRAQAIHVVRTGTFKCVKTLEDGYEQVLGFAGRGEVLGFEALALEQHPVGVVALEDSRVYAVPLREFDAWRRQSPALDHAMLRALSNQLARAGEAAELMAAVAAEVRLARFLVALSASMAARGQSPTRLLLRMTRRDIASLLGVAHETISRSFAVLAEWGHLRVDIREVEILDPEGLRRCARSTRRDMDCAVHRRSAPPNGPRVLAAGARRHAVTDLRPVQSLARSAD